MKFEVVQFSEMVDSFKLQTPNFKLQILRLMSKVKITLVKSPIDKTKRQKLTLEALGFRKMHQTVVHVDSPQIQGMIRTVLHLVEVNKA